MKFQHLGLFIFFNSIFCSAYTQPINNHTVVFHPVFNSVPVRSDDGVVYKLTGDGVIQFEAFKVYISGIELLNDDKIAWKEENSFHLINASNERSLQILLHPPLSATYNKIKFNVGIDSITNTSGAIGGDLDPTKGMYWTWQNGYINCKLEGKSNLCKSRNNEFQFHIGGYQYPYNSLQTIILMLTSRERTDVSIDLGKLINETDLSGENHIMSPSEEAMIFSKKISGIFNVQAK